MKNRARYEVFEGGDGWYYRQVGANGETMNLSQAYTRPEDAERGARDARRAARFAKVVRLEAS